MHSEFVPIVFLPRRTKIVEINPIVLLILLTSKLKSHCFIVKVINYIRDGARCTRPQTSPRGPLQGGNSVGRGVLSTVYICPVAPVPPVFPTSPFGPVTKTQLSSVKFIQPETYKTNMASNKFDMQNLFWHRFRLCQRKTPDTNQGQTTQFWSRECMLLDFYSVQRARDLYQTQTSARRRNSCRFLVQTCGFSKENSGAGVIRDFENVSRQ